MSEVKLLEITVKEVKGECEFGYKVGDSIAYNGREICGEICLEAFVAMIPILFAYYSGANFPWDKNPNKTNFSCPDHENTVLFEINRYCRDKNE